MTEDMNINELPLEIFVEILSKVNGLTLGRCRRVCRDWKDRIDGNDLLWQEMCMKEIRYSSRIAKKKSGNDCSWYHIYKNLKKWSDLPNEINIKEFYKFSLHDKSHILDINYGILPLKDSKGIVLYDTSTLKYIPVAFHERNCLKIANNDYVTVVQIKSGIFVQRTVDAPTFVSEEFFKADNFILTSDILYFYNNRDIFKCDLSDDNLTPKLLIHCDYDIKEMQYSEHIIHIFTDCGKIVSINRNRDVIVKPINCPAEWIRQIRHVCAVDDKNFVCYSRNLIKIEVDEYKHLYLEFPPITALFFYVDVVLFGTSAGEILLYRLCSQKKATKPIFETLAKLPDGKFAVQLDVCERRSGPTIVASTFFELYLLDIPFFPHEQQSKSTFTTNKLHMYKRLLRLKDRLRP